MTKVIIIGGGGQGHATLAAATELRKERGIEIVQTENIGEIREEFEITRTGYSIMDRFIPPLTRVERRKRERDDKKKR
jgi:hypothetical protein